MAIIYSGISVVLREVALRNKPGVLLQHSPKGTVPVLVLANGNVIEESLDIMYWALAINDPQHWLYANEPALHDDAMRLIHENDHEFKPHLDRYKYSTRHTEYPMEYHRAQGELFLQRLEDQLQSRPFLLAERITLADVAITPFVRQFASVDMNWFERSPYIQLQHWLESILDSALFISIMKKYPPWQPGAAEVVFTAG